MGKTYAAGPECRRVCFYPASVFSVTDQRKTAGTKLDTDLMGTSCMQDDTDQGNRLMIMVCAADQVPFAQSFFYTGTNSFHYIGFVFLLS